jgi:hypothetical protein
MLCALAKLPVVAMASRVKVLKESIFFMGESF